MKVWVVIPALSEAARMGACLQGLAPLRGRGHELIVADGGSDDGTAEVARPLCDRVIAAPRGRASQMNAGARAAGGDAPLFLPSDTRLPAVADGFIFGAFPPNPSAPLLPQIQ